jgi:hypothetical protein
MPANDSKPRLKAEHDLQDALIDEFLALMEEDHPGRHERMESLHRTFLEIRRNATRRRYDY